MTVYDIFFINECGQKRTVDVVEADVLESNAVGYVLRREETIIYTVPAGMVISARRETTQSELEHNNREQAYEIELREILNKCKK